MQNPPVSLKNRVPLWYRSLYSFWPNTGITGKWDAMGVPTEFAVYCGSS